MYQSSSPYKSLIKQENETQNFINQFEKAVNLQQFDTQYLKNKLHDVLNCLDEQKQIFQEKFKNEKNLLQINIENLQQMIRQIQYKNQKLQSQNKRIKFNHRQTQLTIQYLKKKISTLQKNSQLEKQKNNSVIQYLQTRNTQLNQIIFQIKQKQKIYNQNIINLQKQLLSLNSQIQKSKGFVDKINIMKQNQFRLNNSQNNNFIKTRQIIDNDNSTTPHKHLNKKKKNHQIQLDYRIYPQQFNVQSSMTNSLCESLSNSNTKQKTIRFEKNNFHYKSVNGSQMFEFPSLSDQRIIMNEINHRRNRQHNKTQDIHKLSGKKILIHNYGQLTFGDCAPIYEKKVQHQLPKGNFSARSSMNISTKSFNKILYQKNLRQF